MKRLFYVCSKVLWCTRVCFSSGALFGGLGSRMSGGGCSYLDENSLEGGGRDSGLMDAVEG